MIKVAAPARQIGKKEETSKAGKANVEKRRNEQGGQGKWKKKPGKLRIEGKNKNK